MADLQTEKMKEYVDKAVGNMKDAVLTGTADQLRDAAAKGLTEATDKNKYALQYAVLNATHAQITTASNKLADEVTAQMTEGFNAMSQHLDRLEGTSALHNFPLKKPTPQKP